MQPESGVSFSDCAAEARAPRCFEFVVAVSQDDAIGRGNRLPWHLRGDLEHFKSLTVGKTILMGRKTYDSIGRALPRRRNVVLTRDANLTIPDCTVVRSLQAAVDVSPGEPVMVIGGAEVYRLCLSRARRIHLTFVHTMVADADAFFDAWRVPEWVETQRIERHADAHNDFDFSLITLDRREPAR